MCVYVRVCVYAYGVYARMYVYINVYVCAYARVCVDVFVSVCIYFKLKPMALNKNKIHIYLSFTMHMIKVVIM